MLTDRFGRHSPERRIFNVVDFINSGQQTRYEAAAGAEHRINQRSDPGACDQIEVDIAADLVEVSFTWVKELNSSLFQGLIIRNRYDTTVVLPVIRDDFFEYSGGGRESGTAESFFDFEAVILWRIMAGGDHHPGSGACLAHGP